MSLQKAIELAKANPIEGLPRMAALIVDKRGKPLGVGFNRYKTHPLQAKFSRNPCSVYLHAEISALVDAQGQDLSDATIYVARVLKNDEPAMAKPCTGCQRAIIAFGLKEVVWT